MLPQLLSFILLKVSYFKFILDWIQSTLLHIWTCHWEKNVIFWNTTEKRDLSYHKMILLVIALIRLFEDLRVICYRVYSHQVNSPVPFIVYIVHEFSICELNSMLIFYYQFCLNRLFTLKTFFGVGPWWEPSRWMLGLFTLSLVNYKL